MPETEEAAVADQQSIAELMATKGYNSNDRPEEISVENKTDNEQKVETKVEVQAAKASAETQVETVVQETKPPTEVTETTQTVIPTWQEVLKQQQPDTVLKELGFDDNKIGLVKTLKELPPQLVGLIDAYKSNGDLSAYLKEMVTDYSKMSSEDVMRNQLRLDYPKASEKAIEALFKKEVIKAYQLNPDEYSEDEVEEGRLLLDAKADKYRETFIERQKQFLIPKAPEAAIESVDSREAIAELAEAARFEERKTYVSNDPFIKNMFSTNKFTIGEGDEAFHFPIDPIEINGILFNGDKWAKAINEVSINDKGEEVIGKPKPEHQALVSLVAKYGKTFLNAYAEHFKTLGAKKAIEPIDNAKPTADNMPTDSLIAPLTPAAAMAKGGKMTN